MILFDFKYAIGLTVYIHCKKWMVDLTNIWLYRLHVANCLQNVRVKIYIVKNKNVLFDKKINPKRQ